MQPTDIEEVTSTKFPIIIDEPVYDFTKYFIENVIANTEDNPKKIKQVIEEVYRDARTLFHIAPSKREIREAYNTNFKDIPISQTLSTWMVKRGMRKQSGVKVVSVLTTAGNTISF